MYKEHPHWIATKNMLTQAYVDLATALKQQDAERIDEERLNIIGLREAAAFVFNHAAFELDFAALCDAFLVINSPADVPDC